jgi:hypothetical protein
MAPISKVEGLWSDGERSWMRAVIHLLSTKHTLKLWGICSSCNINTCTQHLVIYFNETWIFSAAFGKFWSIKFHENLSRGSPVLCRWTEDIFYFYEMNSQRRIWEKFWMEIVLTWWLLKSALEIVWTPLSSKFYRLFWTTMVSVIPLLLIMSDSSMINKNTSGKPIVGLD